MADTEVDDVLAVIANVESDHRVSRATRSAIARLAGDVDDSPLLVHERIKRIGQPEARTMPTQVPTAPLFRVVPLETFYMYCIEDRYRAMSVVAFERAVRRSSDPDQYLTNAVDRSNVIFPATHSWLVDSATVETFSGSELADQLELQHGPPFVLCRLSVDLMAAAGVEVRLPTALDAALSLQPQWNDTGVPAGQEYVDRDIFGSAVEVALWRP